MRAHSWIAGAAAAAALSFATAVPVDAAVDRPFPLVTVTGEGGVSVKPDMAEVVAGVTSEAKTPREAAETNAKTMTTVIAALKEAGLAEPDIRTARFSLFPVQSQRERGEARVTGYRVSNQVIARVRDLPKLGEILDKLIAAGATDINSVQFTASNPAQLLDEARAAAFADARRKAELFAKAAGAYVGRAVNISEDDAVPPRPLRMMAPAAAGRAAPPTPMEPGEEIVRTQVTVSFELNQ
jgi:uncharacterized protein YggE